MTRPATTLALLAALMTLAACEGGYTEATSPCVGADAPRLSFTAEAGVPTVTRRAGDPCAFTALGAP